jgi:hypothetical protein
VKAVGAALGLGGNAIKRTSADWQAQDAAAASGNFPSGRSWPSPYRPSIRGDTAPPHFTEGTLLRSGRNCAPMTLELGLEAHEARRPANNPIEPGRRDLQ